MTDVLGIAVALVAVVVILFLVTGAARPSHGASRTLPAMNGYRAPRTAGGWVSGFVAAIAFAGYAPILGGNLSAATIGSLVGVGFAIVTSVNSATLTRIVLRIAGMVGVPPALFALIAADSCSSYPVVWRLVVGAVLALAGAVGFITSFSRGAGSLHSPLAMFGALRIIGFLASPLGVFVLDLPWYAWLLAPVLAAVLGFLAGWSPDFVIGLTAITVTLSSISVLAFVGAPCGGTSVDEFVVLIGFAVGYFIVRSVAKVVAR